MPAPWISATGSPPSSRSSRTITRPSSSPTRAPRPAWVESSGTSSRWAPVRSRSSTLFASGRSRIHSCAARSAASSRVSRGTATASAYRRSVARSRSTKAIRAIRSSTCSVSASPGRQTSSKASPRVPATPCTTWAPRQAVTAFTARRWPRQNSTRPPPRSAPPCRWAIRSWRSCCSRRASK